MADENAADLTQPVRRKRSAPYPGFSLEEAEELALATFRLGGRNVQQDAVAQALGYSNVKSGSYRVRRAAANYFGMVTYEGFDYITLEEPWIRAFHAEDEAEIRRLRREAFEKPDLYRTLVSEFEGKMLPHEEKLARHLYLNDHFGIRQDAASSAAESFLKSASYAGVVDSRGFLRIIAGEAHEALANESPDPISKSESSPAGRTSAPARGNQPVDDTLWTDRHDRLEIRLGGGRKVFLVIPAPGTLSAAEKERVKAFVDLVLEDDPHDED